MELKFKAYDPIKDEFIYSEKIADGMWRFFKELEDRGMRHFQARVFTGTQDHDKNDVYDGDLISPLHAIKPDHLHVVREVFFDSTSHGFRLDAGNGERQYDKTMMLDYVRFGVVVGSVDQETPHASKYEMGKEETEAMNLIKRFRR